MKGRFVSGNRIRYTRPAWQYPKLGKLGNDDPNGSRLRQFKWVDDGVKSDAKRRLNHSLFSPSLVPLIIEPKLVIKQKCQKTPHRNTRRPNHALKTPEKASNNSSRSRSKCSSNDCPPETTVPRAAAAWPRRPRLPTERNCYLTSHMAYIFVVC